MPTFPSREWMDELCERVAAHPQAGQLAETLDGVYVFVVEPAGPVRARHRYELAIHPGSDSAGDRDVRAGVLDEPAPRPRVVFTARFDRWWQLVHGELDPRMAIMLRRLRVSGDVWRLGRQLDSVEPLLDALGEVETCWPG